MTRKKSEAVVKIRHFAGDCIRFARKIKTITECYFYRIIIVPAQFFLQKFFSDAVYIKTSGSDIKAYKDFCLLAARDENIFSGFRRHKDYLMVMGSEQDEMARTMLGRIEKSFPELKRYYKKFAESEKWGSPFIFEFGQDKFSFHTIRYIKLLSELISIFKNLDGFDVLEIGGGYGGQAKIISDVFNFKSYTQIDFKEVLPLLKKFLEKSGVKNIDYIPAENIPDDKKMYDLAISAYAFSECEKWVQQEYIEKVLKNSKRGFIIYDYDTHKSQEYAPIKPFRKKEIIAILEKYHSLKFFQEEPHMPWNDPFIIVWDDSSPIKINPPLKEVNPL